MKDSTTPKYDYQGLKSFATDLLAKAGLNLDRAECVAEVLIQADLMGHTTHGLALLKPYLAALESGDMTREGEPKIISDRESAIAWDGDYLPGPWLTHRAIDAALERMADHPVVTVTIQRSHHIGSLASYPERATKKNLLMILSCSDPNSELVAPYGGLDPVYSPNPVAAGIPTSERPIIFDTSMSTTAWGVVLRARKEGKRLPAPWLLDEKGEASDDPNVEGTILPIGGIDHGYKGFALGLLVEALTSGLAGFGRDDKPGRWGCSTFLQIIDPAAFSGTDSFIAEMDHFAQRSHDARTRPGDPAVRLPGERALTLRERQLSEGVTLDEGIETSLQACSEKWGIEMPAKL